MKSQQNGAQHLQEGLQKLGPFLATQGFITEGVNEGVASGGHFATATLRRQDFEIGLIVRGYDRDMRFGCPNYSYGHGYAGHDDVLWALGQQDHARLVPKTPMWFVAADGGDPFVALLADLREVVIPALRQSETEFRDAVGRGHDRFLRRVLSGSYSSTTPDRG